MPGHTTIKDVAKKAGVSITTVSFVLNKRPDVMISAEVRKRVIAAAQDLDYHPSAMAAGLAGRRSRNLGIVFGPGGQSISNPFYSFVVEGFIREVMEKGYNILFSRIEGPYEGPSTLPKFVREKNCDGLILVAHSEPAMVRDLADRKVPVVLVDNYPEIEGVNCVHIDNRTGGRLAAEHLVRLGHKNILLMTLGGNSRRPSLEDREAGFIQELQQSGRKLPKECVLECDDLSFHRAHETALEYFKKTKKPAAIFAVNDEMAGGVLKAAAESGRSVPGDVSVMGFDNIIMASYTVPALSTISVAKEHLGRMAASRLLEIIETKDKTVKRELAPVELIIRASTGKPG